MVTALYRRYRPENFADLIGQDQVTEPLSAALSSGRINHAYLFSGPRGCGKTTSARILARCLNCVEGPTPTPCGTCPSCVELSRDGGGSLDVVEIDAASHNGVDDARDLRERAIFAPARDRYKIFILDEAHMVTSQGFNALLKIVEEPPEHVKFIFATTEPDKVIGTIRSRTHHYPFRLIPQQTMLDYVDKLTAAEEITADAGVFALAVRAGGGSARDTLSIVDQLIAGSETSHLGYDRAVALLGYTHSALLSDLVAALAVPDAAQAFAVVQQAVENGQDPRRFVEDLLERFRDLIVVAAGGLQESALPGLSDAEQQHYREEAKSLGVEKLSLFADIVLAALDQLSGATSPKLQLELMLARMLVAVQEFNQPRVTAALPVTAPQVTAQSAPPTQATTSAPASASAPPVTPEAPPVAPPAAQPAAQPQEISKHSGPVDFAVIQRFWPTILDSLQKQKVSVWMMVSNITPVAFEGDVLTLGFRSENDLKAFRQPGQGTAADLLRKTIQEMLGIQVKYLAVPATTVPRPVVPPAEAQATPPAAAESATVDEAPPPEAPEESEPPYPEDEPATQAPQPPQQAAPPPPPTPANTPPAQNSVTQKNNAERYGESVVRQILGARPIDDRKP